MDHSTRASTSSVSSTRVVDVLVPVALNQTYSYRVPRDMDVAPGDVVCVPLGPREAVAVVWAENVNPDPRLHNRLKDVSEKLDVPPLQEELRALVDWVANYTLSARGMVLRMCLRMGEHLGPERVRMGVRLIGAPPSRMTPARRRRLRPIRRSQRRSFPASSAPPSMRCARWLRTAAFTSHCSMASPARAKP